jgi:hypothetical protein
LQQRAALFVPELLKRENDLLKSEHVLKTRRICERPHFTASDGLRHAAKPGFPTGGGLFLKNDITRTKPAIELPTRSTGY